LTYDELDTWERAIGFRSMRRGFVELERKLAEVPDSGRAALLASHADLLDPGSAEPARRVSAHGYASLIDQRGILYVDRVLHKVTVDQLLTSRDGDVAHLEPRAAVGNVQAFQHSGTSSLVGACGNFFSGTRSTSDRREHYTLRTVGYVAEDSLGNSDYRHALEIFLSGQKKDFFGSWISYNTTYQIYNLAVDMDVLRVTSFNGHESQYDFERQTVSLPSWDSPNEAAHISLTMWLGHTIRNPVPTVPALPSFHKAHMETTSRGTFPHRGVVECGFCGDGTCSSVAGETASTCRADCGFCGDGVCFFNESSQTCSSDCRVCGDGICHVLEVNFCSSGSQCIIEPC
jgi:hypothetical protein